MSGDRDRFSLPNLYGAPVHRPRRLGVAETARPLGPDDLPIESFRSPEDRALASELFPRAYTSRPTEALAVAAGTAVPAPEQLRGKPASLRSLAGRLMRSRSN